MSQVDKQEGRKTAEQIQRELIAAGKPAYKGNRLLKRLSKRIGLYQALPHPRVMGLDEVLVVAVCSALPCRNALLPSLPHFHRPSNSR